MRPVHRVTHIHICLTARRLRKVWLQNAEAMHFYFFDSCGNIVRKVRRLFPCLHVTCTLNECALNKETKIFLKPTSRLIVQALMAVKMIFWGVTPFRLEYKYHVSEKPFATNVKVEEYFWKNGARGEINTNFGACVPVARCFIRKYRSSEHFMCFEQSTPCRNPVLVVGY